jgi:serine/tyrosine/threonine adenylyltransferase
MGISDSANPFLKLQYEPAMEELGDDYYDMVSAAEFPTHILRWRNDRILPQIGLNPTEVEDEHFVEAFGQFQGVRPFLALRYHGYQFGEYNPQLGDGRGFLYGQVRGVDGELYDFGTKGSGRTPYSRTADGCLTLKGGVREVLAAEMLHRMGVKTSRCLSLIETGEKLWRGDEPSPTRSSVMVRFSRSHIRFGTFERLHALGRADLIGKLLNHAIAVYYPHLGQTTAQIEQKELYALFYAELVQRVATLVAQWMAAGFCHAVLNTDNMSITGESFDYGPYAFIPTYDPNFTAAYFDYSRRYSYANQPAVCYWNLEMLQYPLRMVMEQVDLEAGLAKFKEHYREAYCGIMLNRLGLAQLSPQEAEEIITLTLQFLSSTQMGYHDFFIALRQQFDRAWREDITLIFSQLDLELSDDCQQILENWRSLYYQYLIRMPESEMAAIAARLKQHNPTTILLRPAIESVWERITLEDDWQPFYDLVASIQAE